MFYPCQSLRTIISYGLLDHENWGGPSSNASTPNEWLLCYIDFINKKCFYVCRFFYWETGYFQTLDITLDRAGYYLCWGCLTWVQVRFHLDSIIRNHSAIVTTSAGAALPGFMKDIVLPELFTMQPNWVCILPVLRLSYLDIDKILRGLFIMQWNWFGYHLCWGCLTGVQWRYNQGSSLSNRTGFGWYLCCGCHTWVQGRYYQGSLLCTNRFWVLPLLGLPYLGAGKILPGLFTMRLNLVWVLPLLGLLYLEIVSDGAVWPEYM
jgi:hypothetical protein